MHALKKLSVVLGLASWLPVGALAQTDWELLRTDADGLTVESRPVAGAELPELKVTAAADVAPARLIAAAWELRTHGMQVIYLEQSRVLSETESERRLFLSYRPPLISRRQCVLRQSRWVEPGTGVQHLRFSALPYTPGKGALPFAHLRGEWVFEPTGAGRARVVYTTLVDVGGVPAVLARAQQLDAAVATVREVVARAHQL
ncbi:MAG: hypothetical protein IPJ65_40105 [Archangiaceae bacterium]|nr:hypothetical protein [Archangiaceae bacterium]